MTAIYVTSNSEKAGRTMLGAGLCKIWSGSGKRIGYLKVQGPGAKDIPGVIDGDVAFMRRAFNIAEPADQLVSTHQNLRVDYNRVSQGKDLVLVEGPLSNGSKVLAEAIDARVILVHDYPFELSPALAEYKKIGKRLVGLFLNKVPRSKFTQVQGRVVRETGNAFIPLLGIIPEDRLMAGLSVGEVAELVKGKILNNAENSAELVENFMLGAMSFDSGIDYFNRKTNKAVILKGDRPDMQLAALQTSLRCLVISGGMPPIPMVAIQAKDKKVPIISADGDVSSLAALLEKGSDNVRFNQEKKLPALSEILKTNANLKVLTAL